MPAFVLLLALPGAAQEPDIAARLNVGMKALDKAGHAEDDERTAKLDEAIALFRAILVRRRDLPRVRLELARAFFLKGEDRLARRQFGPVLASKPSAASPAATSPAISATWRTTGRTPSKGSARSSP